MKLASAAQATIAPREVEREDGTAQIAPETDETRGL
jgi:hypothetical protein